MPEKYETIFGNEGGQPSIFVLEKGIYTWANGDSYKGSYKNDKKMVKAFIIELMNMTANRKIINEIKKIYVKFMLKINLALKKT